MVLKLLLSTLMLTLAVASGASPSSQKPPSRRSGSGSGTSTAVTRGGGADVWADLLVASVVLFVVLAPTFLFRATAASPPRTHPAAASEKKKHR